MTHDRTAGAAYFKHAGPVFQDDHGSYYLTTSEGVQYAFQNPMLFSSARAYGFQQSEIGPAIPIAVDPPDHARFRRAVDRLFAPRVLNPLEDELRRQAGDLIDAFAGKGGCEVIVRQRAPRLPTPNCEVTDLKATMKIEITDRCTGHGRCYVQVPELIEDDEWGHGVVKGDGTVLPDNVEGAERAVRVCPERAIRVIQ
jgi:ferredoxin